MIEREQLDDRLVGNIKDLACNGAPTLGNIFAEDNPGVELKGMRQASVSPKLGGIWRFGENWSLFGNYEHGFRSPPYGDVSVGFTNLSGGYTVIANPDLKPETGNGLEMGLRVADDFNVGDIKYTDWADVNGIAVTSVVLDRYTRPGRTLSASFSIKW